ncbi:MAG: Amuc_1100 family pilus-like protein [Kiritimatiellae bacterium]|nr:Amuc_1100 family pilus-like protein [Kiritimatiellia bacterium]
MEMSKNQLKMAVIGGVGVVIALAAFGMVVMNSSAVTELRDKIAQERSSCAQKRGISSQVAKKAEEARKALSEKALAAYDYVSTNDLQVAKVIEGAKLQNLMNADYERFKKLPEGTSRKIIKEDFAFGKFGDYIKGKVPSKEEAQLLSRQWNDVSILADILVDAGATELTDVKVITPKKEEPTNTNQRGRASRGRNVANTANADNAKYASENESYEITFLARPAALVKFLNLIASSKRFFAVDSLKFEQVGDPLLQAIGADSKEESTRKNKKVNKEEEDPSLSKICVTDPATTEPFTVTMKISAMIFTEKEEAK